MRLNFKIILLVCLLHATCCSGQTYFQKWYKTGYYNYYSTNIFPQPDSSHIIFNYIQDSASGRQDLSLLKIDKNGNELVKKTYGILNTDYLAYTNGGMKQFISATQCSFIASSVVYTSSVSGVIFTKVNKTTLDTIKNVYYYDGVFSYYLNNFIKLNDNKYYLIGNKSNATSQWPFIFQLDSNLNIVNTITLNNPINIACSNAILNPSTKKLLFSGNITYGSNQINIGFIEADTLGVLSSTSIIAFSGIEVIGQLKYSQFDNSYIFNGGIRTGKYGNNNMYRLMLTKISASNLGVVWQKTYGSAAIINNLYTLIPNPDGSIVTCGAYSDSTSLPLMNYDTKAVILKTNANGDSLWMRQYNNYTTNPSPANYRETFFGVERTLDGGYILCGNVLNQPNAKAWIVKTDSLGCVNAGCGSVITSGFRDFVEANSSFEVYPNPASNHLTIKSASPSEPLRILIHDLEGRVLYDERLETSNNLSNLDIDLVNGVYLITIQNSNHETVTKKLVINN